MRADLTVTTDPHAALIRDRSTYWTLGAVFGLLGGLGGGLFSAVLGGLAFGLGGGLLAGLGLGLWYSNTEAAWGRFVLARYWLALRRRLPWRLMGFLADAHKQRGVLRQAGAVYQFRHVDLQRRLATRPAA